MSGSPGLDPPQRSGITSGILSRPKAQVFLAGYLASDATDAPGAVSEGP